MGAFWDAIQAELDRERFAPSDRRLAASLGVAPSTIKNWRNGLTELPKRAHLEAVASFLGQTYEATLLLALGETEHGRGTRLERPAGRDQYLRGTDDLRQRRGNKYLDAAVSEVDAARDPEEPK